MHPEIIPLLEEPALSVTNSETALVIADIHLGIEWDLYKSGFNIPSRIEERLSRIRTFLEQVGPDRIILLGDVKHNVPQVSWQEKGEVPYFLETLAKYAPVDILPGNHDGGIEQLVLGRRGEKITVHSPKGAVLDGVGYFHGHTWPAPELLSVSHVITAHNHPTVRFTDALGYSISEPVWVKTRFNRNAICAHFRSLDFEVENRWAGPEVFIMPAFNELCGGVPINESSQEDLLGPVFSSGGIELEDAELYLLDGTRLGMVKNLRKLKQTVVRNRSFKRSGNYRK